VRARRSDECNGGPGRRNGPGIPSPRPKHQGWSLVYRLAWAYTPIKGFPRENPREAAIKAGALHLGQPADQHVRDEYYMKVKLNLPNHVIAAQMGWSEAAVERMVATYAHAEIGAPDAIDAAFASVPDAGSALGTTVDRAPPPL
jgi:hypothetical protein